MTSKAQLNLRIDSDVAAELRELAEESGISINKLAEGLVAWAVENGHPGIPVEGASGYDSFDAPGIWFGRDGSSEEQYPPVVFFVIDHSPGRPVRDGREYSK